MEDDIKDRLSSSSLWARALYMLFFAIVSAIARAIVTLVAFVQLVFVVLTGRAQEGMLGLGNNLSVYMAEIIRFLTFNTDEKPFPFGPWPDEPIDDSPWLDDERLDDERLDDEPPRTPEPPPAAEPSRAPEPPRSAEPPAPPAPPAPSAPSAGGQDDESGDSGPKTP